MVHTYIAALVVLTNVVALAGLIVRLVNGKCRKAGAASPLKVVFLHPDLGIGGAERLVVDAAVGLQNKGCQVTVYTNFHDPKRCFKETCDGTLRVKVVGSWIPRHVRNKGLVLFATIRMLYLGVYVTLPVIGEACDVYVVDQVAAAMVPLKLLSRRGIFFYCHHPDQLCDPNRVGATAIHKNPGFLRGAYRAVFDAIEGVFMIFADHVVCNSQYTREVTIKTFPSLEYSLRPRDVLYPPIDLTRITTKPTPFDAKGSAIVTEIGKRGKDAVTFVSLNRYERKKGIDLAIKSLRAALDLLAQSPKHQHLVAATHLYVAGGYDPRLAENVEHHKELQGLADQLKLQDHVTFLRSITDSEKYALLSQATCVIYTPTNEHFGIVPLEAMAHKRCVLAVNSGGPTESITTGDKFGFLRSADPTEFAAVMVKLAVNDGNVTHAVGENARKRCEELFSLGAFSAKLLEELEILAQ